MTRTIPFIAGLAIAFASVARTLAETPVGSSFTYQGVLKSGAAPYNGAADLRFMLFDSAAAGNQIGATMEYPASSITDGLFSTTLDFGSLAFNGDERWLQIEVRAPAGPGAYTPVTPRQRMTAVPYALRALNASISGVQPAALTFTNATNAYTGASLDIDSGTLHVNSANDRVGIGTTTPVAKLHVAGDVALNGSGFGLSFRGDTNNLVGRIARLDLPGSSGMTISDFAAGPVTFHTSTILGAAAERVRVTPEGNVGIGTTTPTARLHIAGDVKLNGSGFGLSFQGDTSNLVGRIARLDLPGSSGMTISDFATGPITLCTSTINGAAAERVRVTPEGNVGIGTTNPIDRLTVAGAGTAITTIDDTVHTRLFSSAGTGNGYVGTNTDHGFVIRTNASDRITVTNTGGVGINTASPGAFRLAVNGFTANSTGSWSIFSDARLKTNVRDLPEGTLNKLLALHGRNFEYTREARRNNLGIEGVQTGFIAQEVQSVFPDWVEENNDGYLFITERGTTALMVEALRELRIEKDEQFKLVSEQLKGINDANAVQTGLIIEMREDISALKNENKELRSRIAALEKIVEGMLGGDGEAPPR